MKHRLRIIVYFYVFAFLLMIVTETPGQSRAPGRGFSTILSDVVHPQLKSAGNITVGLDSSNLPIVVIDTQGQTIPDEPKITARMKVINHGHGTINRPTDTDVEYDGYIGIEVRGRFSATFPQKPYAMETRDSLGNNLNVSLLGMPAENDWILLSNYNDKSLLRNMLSFELYRRMGRYAPRARLCEVILNSEYRGVYVFCEKIKPDNNRVDIAKLTPEENSGNDITGGYIINIDYHDASNSWVSDYPPIDYPRRRVYYVYAYPKPDEITSEQKIYIQDFIRAAEGTVYGEDFADPVIGYPKYIDVPSFIDYFILSEVSRNVDGYKKSRFFYKDRDDRDSLLYAGPVWDLDWAWKNITECIYANTDGSGWSYKINDCPTDNNAPDWYIRLLQDGLFTYGLIARYQSLRSGLLDLNTINHYIDSLVIEVDEAQTRHFALWPISDYNPAPEVEPPSQSYTEEIARLKEWIRRRIVWLDANIPKLRENILENGNTSDITIVNASFEQPGTEKVKGWDGACADPNWTGLLTDIPGWVSAVPAFDSGVEEGNATEGIWTGFLMGGDSAVYQVTDHVIAAGDVIKMMVESKNNWQATRLKMELFYFDASDRIVPIISEEVAIGDVMSEHSIAFAMSSAPGAIGHKLGILFDNVSPEPQSWLALDNVRLSNSGITGVTETKPAPTTFFLHQNYPNPFNPDTEIRYALKYNGKVHLSVYDIIGREVAVLVDGVQYAGEHAVTFSGAGMPSGVYFYRLAAGSETITKKMALLR